MPKKEDIFGTPITNLDDLDFLSKEEREKRKQVSIDFPFKITPYYAELAKEYPEIARIAIPSEDESIIPKFLDLYNTYDPSNEKDNIKIPGLQHKYEDTAVFLLVQKCFARCRYCFRKRIFDDKYQENVIDPREGIEYVRQHPEISNVLLTGGDPFTLPTETLESIIEPLSEIDHVDIIRIGSRMHTFYQTGH